MRYHERREVPYIELRRFEKELLGAALLILLQASPGGQTFQGRDLQILVPNGWSLVNPDGPAIRLLHRSGATFEARISGQRQPQNLEAFARNGAELVWRRLGFVQIAEPERRKIWNQTAILYRINGTRLSERKAVSYTAVDHPRARFELIYENSESAFEGLLREVEELASSVRLMSEVREQLMESELRSLNAAQAKYFADNRCYGTLDDLIGAGLADPRVKDDLHGYRLSLRLTQDGYRIDAVSSRSDWMYTEQDGRIRRQASRRPRSR